MKTYDELAALVTAYQNGNEDTYNEIHEGIYPIIKKLVSEMLYNDAAPHNAEDIEDCCIECEMKVAGKIKELKEPKTLVAWVKRISYNTCLDFCKKSGNVYTVSADAMIGDDSDIPFEIEDDNPAFSPDAQMDKKHVVEVVQEFMSALPADQKAALFLVLGEEYTCKEAAEITGVKENTIKYRISAAKKRFIDNKDWFKKRGVDLAVIPFGILLSIYFGRDAYAATAAGAVGAAGAATTTAGTADAGAAATITAGTAGAGTAATVAGTAGTAIAKGLGVKVIAGVLAATLVGSGVAFVAVKVAEKKAESAVEKAIVTEEKNIEEAEFIQEQEALIEEETEPEEKSVEELNKDAAAAYREELLSRIQRNEDKGYTGDLFATVDVDEDGVLEVVLYDHGQVDDSNANDIDTDGLILETGMLYYTDSLQITPALIEPTYKGEYSITAYAPERKLLLCSGSYKGANSDVVFSFQDKKISQLKECISYGDYQFGGLYEYSDEETNRMLEETKESIDALTEFTNGMFLLSYVDLNRDNIEEYLTGSGKTTTQKSEENKYKLDIFAMEFPIQKYYTGNRTDMLTKPHAENGYPAGEWILDPAGIWHFKVSTGEYLYYIKENAYENDGWFWLDSDRDNVAKLYHFDEDGNLSVNEDNFAYFLNDEWMVHSGADGEAQTLQQIRNGQGVMSAYPLDFPDYPYEIHYEDFEYRDKYSEKNERVKGFMYRLEVSNGYNNPLIFEPDLGKIDPEYNDRIGLRCFNPFNDINHTIRNNFSEIDRGDYYELLTGVILDYSEDSFNLDMQATFRYRKDCIVNYGFYSNEGPQAISLEEYLRISAETDMYLDMYWNMYQENSISSEEYLQLTAELDNDRHYENFMTILNVDSDGYITEIDVYEAD